MIVEDRVIDHVYSCYADTKSDDITHCLYLSLAIWRLPFRSSSFSLAADHQNLVLSFFITYGA